MALPDKYIPDAAMDAALDYVAGANELHVCAGSPDDYADVAAHSLGSVAIDSGDFFKANGDTSGRKLTLASQTVSITADGNADHYVLVKTGDSTIRGITTGTSTAVTNGQTKITGMLDFWEIRDPA